MNVVPFRFEEAAHVYRHAETAQEIPHITGLLQRAGLVDPTFFTAEGCERGHVVHGMTAAVDLEAMLAPEIQALSSGYKGYLLAHIELTRLVRPVWEWIEMAMVHRQYGFAGRPDRVGTLFGMAAIAEVKTGPPATWHGVQLGLQALLASEQTQLPPEAIKRYGWYLKPTGKGCVMEYKDRRDLDEAKRIAMRYGIGRL